LSSSVSSFAFFAPPHTLFHILSQVDPAISHKLPIAPFTPSTTSFVSSTSADTPQKVFEKSFHISQRAFEVREKSTLSNTFWYSSNILSVDFFTSTCI